MANDAARLTRLKTEARRAAVARGHTLGYFGCPDTRYGRQVRMAHCRRCDAQVVVNLHPAPNEVDIGGEAVAINCGDSTYEERQAALRAVGA